MNRVNNWIKDYAEKQTFQPANITALKSLNYLMAIIAAVVGALLMGSGNLFLQPSSPPDAQWLAPGVLGFGLWEIVFIIGAILLLVCTALLKGVAAAHVVLAVMWLTFGSLWTIGGVINSPSYLFGVGILGIFMGLQHIALVGVWRAEGV